MTNEHTVSKQTDLCTFGLRAAKQWWVKELGQTQMQVITFIIEGKHVIGTEELFELAKMCF